MDKHTVFETVRQAVSLGDTGQALQVFLAYLESSGQHPDLLRSLRVIEANFNTAKRKEGNGILSYQEARSEYAKANDALLSMLEMVATGNVRTMGAATGPGRKRMVWFLSGGLLLLLGLAGGYFWFAGNTAIDQNVVPLPCPKFRVDGLRVMVLEFQRLSGADSKPELGIQTRILDLTERNQINTDVRILPAKTFDSITPSTRDATAFGQQCEADMVIWGQYEQLQDSISVDIRYAFTAPDWPPGASLETFRNVTELKSDRMKINNLDEAVFRLCTAMALHENRLDLAEKWLNKIQKPNAREQEWKEMLAK
jgi:hypothetical protein